MSNLNGQKASLVRLHASTHVLGLGNIGPVVDTNSGKTLGSATLTVDPLGVVFECRGLRTLLPWPNIISAQLLPEAGKATVVGKIDL